MTYTFTLQIDRDDDAPKRLDARVLAQEIHRVLTHATEVDIAGAEHLNSDIGQISVTAHMERGKG